ncbi:MAG TPA: TonB family protein [Nitrospirota bacterium]|nr:TonB family protein [Nitrospirota bacterium]
MSDDEEKQSISWILIAVFVLLVGAGVYIVKTFMSGGEPRKKDTIATITLLKPPVIKEKPPEPEEVKEIPKKEEIINPEMNEAQTPQNENPDNTPAGDSLGVDAEGGAGSDNFGLVGKKGGRSLLAGGSGAGSLSLLSKFTGYTQIVTTELRKKVMKHLDEEGGIPKGKLQAVVRVSVDMEGKVIDYRIIGSSGNTRMDEAIIDSLRSLRISEPPPEGMPRTMNIRITSQG